MLPIEKSIKICVEDEAFESYLAREKTLAFVFTLLQQLDKEKDTNPALQTSSVKFLTSDDIKESKKVFKDFFSNIIDEGIQTGEILSRPFLTKYYADIIWAGILQVILFRKNDQSKQYEQTDVMVEKTIHFFFDLLSPGALDSGIEWASFLIKRNIK
jgi:hypothetical protein